MLSSTACGGSGGGTTPPPSAYCGSNGSDASYEWIAKVKVGAINHSSGNNGGYEDFSGSISTDLNKGNAYLIELTPGFSNQTYNEYWKIWIDYNQDQDFDDPGELVFDAGNMSSTTVNGTFTVSNNATIGQTKMRVAMKYNGASTACETFDYGEVEDYSVNIVNGQSQIPSTSYCHSKGNDASYEWIANVTMADINNSSGSDQGYHDYTSIATDVQKDQSYNISLTPGFASSSYNEYWKVWIDYNQDGDFDDNGELAFDAGTMSSSTVNGAITISSNALVGETRMRVSMKYNASQSPCEAFSYGEVEDYTLNIIEAGQAVTYCTSQGNNSTYEWIAGVQLGTLNSSSGNDGGYADYTSQSTSLTTGNSYNLTLTPGFSGQTYQEYWKVWIDFNKDGDFLDANELVFDAGAMSNSTVNGNLTIPANANTGSTRMRVSMKYNAASSSCEAFSYGEVEDYTVTIVSGSKDIGSVEEAVQTTTPELSIYPNPTKGIFNLQIADINEEVQVTIYDIQGRAIYNDTFANGASANTIDLTGFATGTYYVVAYNAELTMKSKLVLVK
ncbi:T9SS type A sorting domain-containing protein [Paracrocinitomix mangrovi]|nr:GEVED domain-containing protein [Paracrocinitomix mangrovi]UKN03885.1 T9SS type A sorting domain-containing protein [Paracrocinitomix mangrovi]